jgi:hypothetical protein
MPEIVAVLTLTGEQKYAKYRRNAGAGTGKKQASPCSATEYRTGSLDDNQTPFAAFRRDRARVAIADRNVA